MNCPAHLCVETLFSFQRSTSYLISYQTDSFYIIPNWKLGVNHFFQVTCQINNSYYYTGIPFIRQDFFKQN